MPRIVILDLRLPGKSGQDLCREIKQECSTVPILVLSAASDVLDKVLLLELGADDYVTKVSARASCWRAYGLPSVA